MPPKRDATELRALADDPLKWLQTPVASRADVGLAVDYLSAFLKHHQMPVTRRQVDGLHGLRLRGAPSGQTQALQGCRRHLPPSLTAIL